MTITVPDPVVVSVTDTAGAPQAGLLVYAFDGTIYTNFHGTTDAAGQVSLRLPPGDYRFRVDLNGTQFWSGGTNHCTVPECTMASITVTEPVTVTVQDDIGNPRSGLQVYAFSGGVYTNIHATTDASGQVVFTLPEASYRFRANSGGTQFWSSGTDDCTIPGCLSNSVTVSTPITVSVQDTNGDPMADLPVYAFDGSTYTNFNKTTDAAGQAFFTLPQGSYRFRADLNGTQFWSSGANDCDVPGCLTDSVTVTIPVTVSVEDTDGTAMPGLPVYVFDGNTYTGLSKTTDASGQATFTLQQGSYRFRADLNGTQFFSMPINHSAIPGCGNAAVTVTKPVTVTVEDGSGTPLAGIHVYAFDGTTYTNFNKTTDAAGEAIFTLPIGSYRFRADVEGTQYWSGPVNHCTIPGCESVVVTAGALPTEAPTATGTSIPPSATPTATVPPVSATPTATPVPPSPTATATLVPPTSTSTHTPVPPTATDTGTPVPATSTPTPTDTPTSEPPTATFTPTPFAFGGSSGLAMLVSGQRAAASSYQPAGQTNSVCVTVQNTNGDPQSGVPVYAFDGDAFAGTSATTDGGGVASFGLQDGSYRFRADFNGTEFWSSDVNDCAVPGCSAYTVIVTVPVAVTVSDTGGSPHPGLPVYAFDGAAYSGYHATTDAKGQVLLTLPQGSYRFRADLNGTQFFSSSGNDCTIPGCTANSVIVTIPVVVTVQDTNGAPQAGLPVYAFSGGAYTGYYATTDASGQAAFTLPQGPYRFRADLSGTQFWSSTADDCAVPGCTAVTIQTTLPVTLTVQDTSGAGLSGLPAYVFDGSTYTGFNGTTDASGQVTFTLPAGSYQFRVDLNGTQFWSSATSDCTVPGCETDTVTVTVPVTVTVQDTDGGPQVGLSVYAFSGGAYSGYHGTTDASGQAVFPLPQGAYRFRADLNGTEFWSDSTDSCAIPGCTAASVTVAIPVTVTVASQSGTPYPDTPVFVFDGDTYTGYHGHSDANGQVVFTLSEGSYRFRADYNNVPFWSAESNDCTVPGCTTAAVTVPGGFGTTTTTIDYGYDPLYRLISADYSSGEFFHYTYDAVGNRMTQHTLAGPDTYSYDEANRLTSVNGVAYSWDANGNLLDDGTSAYAYDHASRLVSVDQGSDSYAFSYNALGDRLQQTENGTPTDYTLDLNTGLTQVLSDGTNAYLYGLDRIAQEDATNTEYFIGDALGSVRQLADSNGQVTLAETYAPFGVAINSAGNGSSIFGFALQQTDANGLGFLRARYYSPDLQQFIQPDSNAPDPYQPLDWNLYLYTWDNPVNYVDPSGLRALLVLVCGVGTNGACEHGVPLPDYANRVPLSPFRDWASQNGAFVKNFDYDLHGSKQSLAMEIEHFIEQHADANFILVGHSAGADSVVWAANLYFKAPRADTSRMSGVMVLDMDLGTHYDESDIKNITDRGIPFAAFHSLWYPNLLHQAPQPAEARLVLPSGLQFWGNLLCYPFNLHKYLAIDQEGFDRYMRPLLNHWSS